MLSTRVIPARAGMEAMPLLPGIWCRYTQEKCVSFWGFHY